jgi:hypothetical protein
VSARRITLGLAAAGLYVAAAMGLAGNGPVLPLYDIGPITPQPYRWTHPPPEFEQSNVQPEPTRQEVALAETGSVSASIVTPDGQAALVVRDGSFAPRLGEIAVFVELVPVDPATLGPPPQGLAYDGNAYRVTATYQKEGAPGELANPATVVLRAPLGGTHLLRHDGGTGWEEITAQPVAASLQVFGETTKLGAFVAAQTVHAKPFPWTPVSLGASGLAVAAAWVTAAHVRQRKERQRPRRDRRAMAKGGSSTRPRPSPPRKKKRR